MLPTNRANRSNCFGFGHLNLGPACRQAGLFGASNFESRICLPLPKGGFVSLEFVIWSFF